MHAHNTVCNISTRVFDLVDLTVNCHLSWRSPHKSWCMFACKTGKPALVLIINGYKHNFSSDYLCTQLQTAEIQLIAWRKWRILKTNSGAESGDYRPCDTGVCLAAHQVSHWWGGFLQVPKLSLPVYHITNEHSSS